MRWWLYGVASLVFALIVVGGATRLTDSGLSITEWRPIMGIIPPLSEADWEKISWKEHGSFACHIDIRGQKIPVSIGYKWNGNHRINLGHYIGDCITANEKCWI